MLSGVAKPRHPPYCPSFVGRMQYVTYVTSPLGPGRWAT